MILALLLSAMAMARPQSAAAAGEIADCHSAMASGDAPEGSGDHPRALGHVCPGCAAFAPPFAALKAMPPLPLPLLDRAAVRKASVFSVPLKPPPKLV